MPKFMLTGALKGKTVVLGMNQYSFVEGVLECSEEDADKIQERLETYYGAKRLAEKGQPTEDDAKKAAEETAAAAKAEEAAKKPAAAAGG